MRLVTRLCSILVVAPLAASPLAAGTFSASVDGFVGPGDPNMLVAIISTPNCTGGYGGVDVFYDLHPLAVGEVGTYQVDVLSSTGNTAFYLYENTFDPGAAANNCYAASNTGNPQVVTVQLNPGTQYFVVPIDDTFAQLGDTYTLTVEGPGPINLGDYVPPIIQEIPTLSTWGLGALGLVLALLGLVLVRRRAVA